jgi:hypothetical protein
MDKLKKIKKGKYLHFKGSFYLVIDFAIDSESLEEMVIYQSLEDNKKWVRPIKMFAEKVKFDGKMVPRFKYMGNK